MKFSVRFWMIVALLSSVAVACNRTEEPPASSVNQSSALPSTEQPAAQPAQQEAAPEPAEPKPTRRPAPAPARTPAAPSGVKAVTASEPSASTRAAAPNTPAPAPVPAPKPVEPPEVVSIPSGTSLTVVMIDPVGTDTSKPGDTFTASLGEPVVINGKTVIAKGTKVQGRVETVDEPGRVKGKAALSLVLTQLMSKDKVYPLSTEPYTAEAESGKKKDALKVGGGAGLGAVIGAIAGGGKGAAIGAAVGGGAGTAAVLATKGQQLKIEPEAKLTFVLEKGVDIVLTKSTS